MDYLPDSCRRGQNVWSERLSCVKSNEIVTTCKLKCEKTSVQAPQAFCVIAGQQNIQSRKRSNGFSFLNITHYRETLGPFSRLRRGGGGGRFEGGKCTCPLATCEKLYRGASSPSLVFIKCVKAKRLLNGNALKQIDHTGSNCPAAQSQERTDWSYPNHIRGVISPYQAEYS